MSTTTSATATLLQSLKVTAAKKAVGNNPQVLRRMKLARKLWEQIQLAKSQADGTNFTMTRFRSVTDPDGRRPVLKFHAVFAHGGGPLRPTSWP